MIATLNNDVQSNDSGHRSYVQAVTLPKVRRREIRLLASQIVHAHCEAAWSPSVESRSQLLFTIQQVYGELFGRRFRRRARPLAIVIYTLCDSMADFDNAETRPELQTCNGVLAHLDGFIRDLCRLMAIDRDATIEDMPHTVNRINIEDAFRHGRCAMPQEEFEPINSVKDAWFDTDYSCTSLF